MNDLGTTLVAVATPPGRGGVGCVRISGRAALELVPRLFAPTASSPVDPGGRPRFGRFLARDGNALDHGYVVAFAAGASFTGELTVELWSHGSPAVLSELVAAAVAAGATPASPGEFTYRALRNGRLDLTRAEAVRDLVDARTIYQARVAFAQADGSLSRRVDPLRERLEEWIARTEAAVEFVDEAETHLGTGQLAEGIEACRRESTELLRGFEFSRVVRDGARLAMVGRPNVGKSSLFNALLARDRAIVDASAGTTRDTLEAELDLDGVPVRLVDTAGLRESADAIESEGVRRARLARREADLVILVLDGACPLELDDRTELDAIESDDGGHRSTLVVVNKGDLPDRLGRGKPAGALSVSARTGQGLDSLRESLRDRLLGGRPSEQPILTNVRHAEALERTVEALGRAAEALAAGLSEELILEDLKAARSHLGEITGELATDALYDRIFSSFCIGK